MIRPRSKDVSDYSYRDLIEMGWMIAGSAETVAERLERLTSEMGSGRVILGNDFVSQPRWMLRRA